MTNENSSTARMGFGGLLSGSVKLFFTKIGLFAPILVIFLFASFVINYFSQKLLYSNVGAMGMNVWLLNGITLLVSLFSFVLAALQALSMIKASNESLKGRSIDFTEAISYGFKNLWKGMITMFRQFWYVFWVSVLPVIVLLIAFAIFQTVNGMGGVVYNVDSTAVAQGLLSPVGTGEIEEITLGPGMLNLGDEAGVSLQDPYLAVSMAMQYLFSGLGIVLVVWMFVFMVLRGIRSMFAMFVLVDQGKSWTDALKGSIELTKGNFWRIFGYMLLFWLILMAFMFLLMMLGMTSARSLILMMILNLIVGFLVGGIVTVFMNKLYLALKAGK